MGWIKSGLCCQAAAPAQGSVFFVRKSLICKKSRGGISGTNNSKSLTCFCSYEHLVILMDNGVFWTRNSALGALFEFSKQNTPLSSCEEKDRELSQIALGKIAINFSGLVQVSILRRSSSNLLAAAVSVESRDWTHIFSSDRYTYWDPVYPPPRCLCIVTAYDDDFLPLSSPCTSAKNPL